VYKNHFRLAFFAKRLNARSTPNGRTPRKKDLKMKRILVYSHDTFGLGNIRRIMSICEHLTQTSPELNILVLSGSPMLHSFRIPPRTDYIKLPCLSRTDKGRYGVKYLATDLSQAIRLRAEIINSAAVHFRPDVFLVDKKPLGVENELRPTVQYLKEIRPQTRLALLLRDVLDEPSETIAVWRRHRYHDVINRLYDSILVVGSRQIFDVASEYEFPQSSRRKMAYCGYLRRPVPELRGRSVRTTLGIGDAHFVVVTPGGGEDGRLLVETFLSGIKHFGETSNIHAGIIFGPEMSADLKEELEARAQGCINVHVIDFTPDIMSWFAAADLVVSMGGYNTVCEILSLNKRGIIVPRTRPVREQLIRARRLSERRLLRMIHPDELNPEGLMAAVHEEINRPPSATVALDMDGLPRVTRALKDMMRGPSPDSFLAAGALERAKRHA
jgi:predicted glycosyltransferase